MVSFLFSLLTALSSVWLFLVPRQHLKFNPLSTSKHFCTKHPNTVDSRSEIGNLSRLLWGLDMDCVPNREYVESWTFFKSRSSTQCRIFISQDVTNIAALWIKKKMFPLVDQGPLLIQVCVKYVHKTYDLSCLNYASFLYF